MCVGLLVTSCNDSVVLMVSNLAHSRSDVCAGLCAVGWQNTAVGGELGRARGCSADAVGVGCERQLDGEYVGEVLRVVRGSDKM